MKDYNTPQEVIDFCTEEEIKNLPNQEHLFDVLSRIIKRLDLIESKK
tara:strand:+ start:788 stop:928 length:141 start_codon:yes stop_codon:yes gene_type:complete